MTGRIVYMPAPPVYPHVCQPPTDDEFGCFPMLPETDPQEPAPVGTVWQCECGATWVASSAREGDCWRRESRWARWRRTRRAPSS